MKALLSAVAAVCLFGLIAPTQTESADCRADLQQQSQVLVLVAAGTLFGEARPLADHVLGVDWPTKDLGQLGRSVFPDSLRVGCGHLCSWLESLPSQEQQQRDRAITEWVQSYRTVEVLKWLIGVESLGSAVAHLSETQSLFPRNPSEIAEQGATVGESLAAGENTGLWYGLASYLTAKGQEERGRIVAELLRLGRSF